MIQYRAISARTLISTCEFLSSIDQQIKSYITVLMREVLTADWSIHCTSQNHYIGRTVV